MEMKNDFLSSFTTGTLPTSVNPALPTQHEKLCCSKKSKGKTGICAVQSEQAYDSNLCNESVNLCSHDEICSEVLFTCV